MLGLSRKLVLSKILSTHIAKFFDTDAVANEL